MTADPKASGMTVRDAILGRRSVRGFRPEPVPRELLLDILRVASRSPSGTNLQPWKVHVCTGARKEALSERLVAAHDAGGEGHEEEYPIYPAEWREPYLSRRRGLGLGLYSLLGIGRDDKAARHAHFARNYRFFGAPVALFFTMDRDMEQGSWLDMGMFMQSVMLAARAHGLETCPQQAFVRYHRIVCEVLEIPPGERMLCGMALGYPDETEPANRLHTERAPVEDFVRFVE